MAFWKSSKQQDEEARQEAAENDQLIWFTSVNVRCPGCGEWFTVRSSTATQRPRPCKHCNRHSFELRLGRGAGHWSVWCDGTNVTETDLVILLRNVPHEME